MGGYDGAPESATLTDGAPRCEFIVRDISPAGDRAFQVFYFDTDGIQTALAKTWGKLAGEFKDEPMVAGFDLLNEPGFGETARVTTAHKLGDFFDKAITEIRAGGAPQMVFIEPSILWSGLVFDSGAIPASRTTTSLSFPRTSTPSPSRWTATSASRTSSVRSSSSSWPSALPTATARLCGRVSLDIGVSLRMWRPTWRATQRRKTGTCSAAPTGFGSRPAAIPKTSWVPLATASWSGTAPPGDTRNRK